MSNAVECIRCHAQMESGWLPDDTRAGLQRQNWSPGEPQPSFWTGLKSAEDRGLPITTFRCPKCGYLESYARPQSQDGASVSRTSSSRVWRLAAFLMGLALLLLGLGLFLLTRAK
jgi:hypothetical protein